MAPKVDKKVVPAVEGPSKSLILCPSLIEMHVILIHNPDFFLFLFLFLILVAAAVLDKYKCAAGVVQTTLVALIAKAVAGANILE